MRALEQASEELRSSARAFQDAHLFECFILSEVAIHPARKDMISLALEWMYDRQSPDPVVSDAARRVLHDLLAQHNEASHADKTLEREAKPSHHSRHLVREVIATASVPTVSGVLALLSYLSGAPALALGVFTVSLAIGAVVLGGLRHRWAGVAD